MWWSFALFVVRCGVSHLQVVWLPAWHTVYSSGKYEVSRGISLRLVFLFARFFRPFSCLEARGSSYFPSEHTMHPPAFSVYVCETLFYCAFYLYEFFYTLFRCAKIAWLLVACFFQNSLAYLFMRDLLCHYLELLVQRSEIKYL